METVRVVYHHEADGWWAESPDVDGWSAPEARSRLAPASDQVVKFEAICETPNAAFSTDCRCADFLKEISERAAAFKEQIGKRIDEGATQTTTRVISFLSFRRGNSGELARRKGK